MEAALGDIKDEEGEDEELNESEAEMAPVDVEVETTLEVETGFEMEPEESRGEGEMGEEEVEGEEGAGGANKSDKFCFLLSDFEPNKNWKGERNESRREWGACNPSTVGLRGTFACVDCLLRIPAFSASVRVYEGGDDMVLWFFLGERSGCGETEDEMKDEEDRGEGEDGEEKGEDTGEGVVGELSGDNSDEGDRQRGEDGPIGTMGSRLW